MKISSGLQTRHGLSRLEKILRDLNLKNADVSDAIPLKKSNRELVANVLGGRKKVTPKIIEQIALAVFSLASNKHKKLQWKNAKQLTNELLIYFGFLPEGFFESDELKQILMGLLNTHELAPNSERSARWLEGLQAQVNTQRLLNVFAKSWKGDSGSDFAEEIWQTVVANWNLMQSEQRAWAAMLRAEVLKSRGLSTDALIFLRFAQTEFADEPHFANSPTRSLRYRLHCMIGDTYRELGRGPQALSAYKDAEQYAEAQDDLIQTQRNLLRLQRKQLNALLRVEDMEKISELGIVSKLDKVRISGRVPGTREPLNPAERARLRYSLAWHARMQGNFATSKKYLSSLIGQNDIELRVKAVGEQYLLETLLRLGEFEEAKELIRAINQRELEAFPNPGDTRRSFSLLICARVYFYSAMLHGKLGQNHKEQDHEIGLQFLDKAVFGSSITGANSRRAQILIEHAKMVAFLRGFGDLNSTHFSMAKQDLALAQSIINSLGTFRSHIQSAIDINQVIVNLLQYREARERKQGTSINLSALSQQINSLEKSKLSPGHSARIDALRACAALLSGGDAASHIRKSATRTLDRMVLLDCRWLISACAARGNQTRILKHFDHYSDQKIATAKIGSWL